MKIKENFEIVNIAGDYMLVPIGDQLEQFKGTVVLNEVSAFLLEKMKKEITKEELVQSLLEEYEVDPVTAKEDVENVLEAMRKTGIIND